MSEHRHSLGARLRARWHGLPAEDRRNIALLIVIAAAVRLGLILFYSPVLLVDSHSYLDLAHRLATLHLQGSSGARTPGYPLLLLALGYSPVANWCVQALLGVLTTLLVYALARRLGVSARLALLAGLLYGLDLEALALERMVLTETLTGFLLLVGGHLTVSIVSRRRPRYRLLVALGLVLAYLCLVRPDQLIITAYLAVALAVVASGADAGGFRGGWRGGARSGLTVILPSLLVLAAWAGVNRATIGVTSVSTVLGYNMIDHVAPYVQPEPGANHGITSAYVAARRRRLARTPDLTNLTTDAQAAMERASGLDAAHLSERLLGIALGVIAQHPLQYLTSSLRQWPRFWVPPNYPYEFARGAPSAPLEVIWQLERALLALINLAFVLLFLTDLIQRIRRRRPLLSRPIVILSGIAIVAMLPATFLAYGETGRYGSVTFPLVLSITVAGSILAWRATARWRPLVRGGATLSSTSPARWRR